MGTWVRSPTKTFATQKSVEIWTGFNQNFKKNSVRRLFSNKSSVFHISNLGNCDEHFLMNWCVLFPLGWSNSVWVAKCRLLGSLHYPPTKNYRPSQDIHAWNGLQGGNTTVYLDLLLWCLENVKDILLNGGLMVIYHGTKLKQILKQIQVYSKPHLRNKQLVFLWQEFQEPKKKQLLGEWSLQCLKCLHQINMSWSLLRDVEALISERGKHWSMEVFWW